MADDELRRLARDAAASQDPEPWLAYAAALRRAGRGDEALSALAGGPSHPDIDAAIRAASWSSPAGGDGRTRWIDLEPLSRGPHLRWATHYRDWCRVTGLIVDPRVVVVAGHGTDGRDDPCDTDVGLRLLDPDTGEQRAFCRGPKDLLGVVGDAVLAYRWTGIPYSERSADYEVSAWGLLDGEQRWTLRTPRAPSGLIGQEVIAGDGRELWRYGCDASRVGERSPLLPFDYGFEVAGAAGRLTVSGDENVILAGGAELARHPRLGSDHVAGDAQGWLLYADSSKGRVAALSPEGALRAELPRGARTAVLGADFVALGEYGRDPIELFTRQLEPQRSLDPRGASLRCGAGAWLYGAGAGTVRGFRVDGRARWKFPEAEILAHTFERYRSWDHVDHLAPGPGQRLYGVSAAGTAFCLEERAVRLSLG